MDERGIRAGSRFEVGQGRQVLEVDLDQRGRLSSDLRCRGRDGRDQLALPAHDVPGKERPVLQVGAVSDLGDVGGREDRMHARERARRRRIQAADTGMWGVGDPKGAV